MILPEGVTQDQIDDADESRELMGDPFTPLGKKRFISRCGRAYRAGLDIDDLIDKMVEGGENGPWRTIHWNKDSLMRPKTLTRDTTGPLTVVDTSDPETAAEGLKQAKGAMQ